MSPILDLQRRLREAGRIRIGTKDPDRGYPKKLTTFRLTSPDHDVIVGAATQFGGNARPWGDQWEVITTTDRLEVIVPPTDMAFSQFYELWSGGGCQRRCDGATELLTDQPCLCDPEVRECTPHTRLSLMLPDLATVGLWRLDTQGWNAAVELAGSVDLALAFAQRGTYLPAELRLEQREQRKPGKDIRKFVVPILDLKVSVRALGAVGSGAPEGTGEAIPSPSFSPVPASLPVAPVPSITEQLAPRERRHNGREAVPIPSTGLDVGPALGDVPATASEGGGEIAESPPPDDERATVPLHVILCTEIAAALGTKDDDARHAFLAEYSDGRYSSSKAVPVREVAALRSHIVAVKRERDQQAEMFPDSDLEQLSARELFERCVAADIDPVPRTKAERIAALRERSA